MTYPCCTCCCDGDDEATCNGWHQTPCPACTAPGQGWLFDEPDTCPVFDDSPEQHLPPWRPVDDVPVVGGQL